MGSKKRHVLLLVGTSYLGLASCAPAVAPPAGGVPAAAVSTAPVGAVASSGGTGTRSGALDEIATEPERRDGERAPQPDGREVLPLETYREPDGLAPLDDYTPSEAALTPEEAERLRAANAERSAEAEVPDVAALGDITPIPPPNPYQIDDMLKAWGFEVTPIPAEALGNLMLEDPAAPPPAGTTERESTEGRAFSLAAAHGSGYGLRQVPTKLPGVWQEKPGFVVETPPPSVAVFKPSATILPPVAGLKPGVTLGPTVPVTAVTKPPIVGANPGDPLATIPVGAVTSAPVAGPQTKPIVDTSAVSKDLAQFLQETMPKVVEVTKLETGLSVSVIIGGKVAGSHAEGQRLRNNPGLVSVAEQSRARVGEGPFLDLLRVQGADWNGGAIRLA